MVFVSRKRWQVLSLSIAICAEISDVFCQTSGLYILLDSAYLCVSDQFTVNHTGIINRAPCSILCTLRQRCQAFATWNGWCQLLVFDECSKNVRDCSCSKRGQVFVKQQSGLEPGALCPSGYGDDLCGTKYKFYNNSGYWWPSRAKCESESGLVIMADVVDDTEMSHVDMLYNLKIHDPFWLGGYQPAGSPEPGGGWCWVGCNISLPGNSSLWRAGEPNNMGKENAIARFDRGGKLNDAVESSEVVKGVLCECLSPFD